MKAISLNRIRVSDAKQYQKLQELGTMLKMKSDFILGCECVAHNKSNIYIKHPNMKNTSILVFGGNTEAYYFGVMVDTHITCDNGKRVNLPQILSAKTYSLKMSQNRRGEVGNRGFLINNVNKVKFGKKQIRLEEAIIAIKKYGDIVPLRLEGMPECENEIHHSGYPFDCRLDNLMWLSRLEHKEIHKNKSYRSHLRSVEAVLGTAIPEFVDKKDEKNKKNKEEKLQ